MGGPLLPGPRRRECVDGVHQLRQHRKQTVRQRHLVVPQGHGGQPVPAALLRARCGGIVDDGVVSLLGGGKRCGNGIVEGERKREAPQPPTPGVHVVVGQPETAAVIGVDAPMHTHGLHELGNFRTVAGFEPELRMDQRVEQQVLQLAGVQPFIGAFQQQERQVEQRVVLSQEAIGNVQGQMYVTVVCPHEHGLHERCKALHVRRHHQHVPGLKVTVTVKQQQQPAPQGLHLAEIAAATQHLDAVVCTGNGQRLPGGIAGQPVAVEQVQHVGAQPLQQRRRRRWTRLMPAGRRCCGEAIHHLQGLSLLEVLQGGLKLPHGRPEAGQQPVTVGSQQTHVVPQGVHLLQEPLAFLDAAPRPGRRGEHEQLHGVGTVVRHRRHEFEMGHGEVPRAEHPQRPRRQACKVTAAFHGSVQMLLRVPQPLRRRQAAQPLMEPLVEQRLPALLRRQGLPLPIDKPALQPLQHHLLAVEGVAIKGIGQAAEHPQAVAVDQVALLAAPQLQQRLPQGVGAVLQIPQLCSNAPTQLQWMPWVVAEIRHGREIGHQVAQEAVAVVEADVGADAATAGLERFAEAQREPATHGAGAHQHGLGCNGIAHHTAAHVVLQPLRQGIGENLDGMATKQGEHGCRPMAKACLLLAVRTAVVRIVPTFTLFPRPTTQPRGQPGGRVLLQPCPAIPSRTPMPSTAPSRRSTRWCAASAAISAGTKRWPGRGMQTPCWTCCSRPPTASAWA